MAYESPIESIDLTDSRFGSIPELKKKRYHRTKSVGNRAPRCCGVYPRVYIVETPYIHEADKESATLSQKLLMGTGYVTGSIPVDGHCFRIHLGFSEGQGFSSFTYIVSP
jgi:hypothetical protein